VKLLYILIALLLKAFVNLLLAFLNIGSLDVVKLTKKGGTYQTLLEAVPVLVYFVAAMVSVHFLGW